MTANNDHMFVLLKSYYFMTGFSFITYYWHGVVWRDVAQKT